MALSPNYGWSEPDNSSLVKNGAQDIRTLGDAIDTSVWNIGFGQAGKNKIINGDFGIWQRGTSFSSPASGAFLADRYFVAFDGSPTVTYSRQTFTPGTAPVSGYESSYFFRAAMTNASTTASWNLYQKIEDVRTFAGQTITVSFWAKADSARTVSMNFLQEFGSGGSGAVFGGAGQNNSVTSSWQRFSYSLTLPSISGKTIGTGSSLTLYITLPISATTTVDLWGVQVEAGSKATPFQTATGTLQGELAACQRYYFRAQSAGGFEMLSMVTAWTTTNAEGVVPTPVQMRIIPTVADAGNLSLQLYGGATVIPVTGLTVAGVAGKVNPSVAIVVASGLTVGSQYRILLNNTTAAYVAFSAEL
jgi:hypothetical protein